MIVANNRMLGTIRMHQERRYPGRVIATDLVNPDFAALARAYGAFGERVEHADELPGALAAAREAMCDGRSSAAGTAHRPRGAHADGDAARDPRPVPAGCAVVNGGNEGVAS